jgi:phosphoribosylformylglycinamidine synthase
MSAKGNVGMRIDLDKVPTRQKNMKAWELLLSESQERMLLVAEKGKEQAIKEVFEKWDLPCSEVGAVTDDGILHFYLNGELEAQVPAHELVLGGGAPQYTREYKEPEYLKKIQAFNPNNIADIEEKDILSIAEQLIQLPNIASKRWVTVQYDSMVGAANASTNAPSDASIVLAHGTGKALTITTDCNGRYVFADPYTGAMIAVAEAARNIVCSGGEPIGVTNCLNFGNPYQPEVYYQFVKAVTGMGDACRKFNTPVTGGNVSFYNQNPAGAVYPTPTIGMVGIIDDIEDKMTLDFKQAGDVIYLIGVQPNDIGSSEYLHKIRGVEYSTVPYFNIEEEYNLHNAIALLIKQKLISNAHDISEGGLFTALLESGFHRNLGFESNNTKPENIRIDAYWFGEAQGRVVVSTSEEKTNQLEAALASNKIPYAKIGTVTSGNIIINDNAFGSIKTWKEKYDTAIEQILDKADA